MQKRLIHRRLTFFLQIILVAEILAATWQQQWLAMVLTIGILLITLAPLVIGRFFRVFIPPEFVLLAILFVFASLFLGEVRGYYTRYWWWDIALHTSSGFLLGIVGFLLVHVMNEVEDINRHMRPGFVAFFAFLFAVAIGALWEIFEFAMDTFIGFEYAKTHAGRPLRPDRHHVGPDRRYSGCAGYLDFGLSVCQNRQERIVSWSAGYRIL
ncbi:MAG: hypothetical protein MH208_10290 [Marinobacter sp.]|nr:hypothetical protein [Marinobacter sp.]